MFGPPGWTCGKAPETDMGIIPRAVDALFQNINKVSQKQSSVHVYASFVQIYREQIYDMLRDPTRATPLAIRQEETDADGNFVIGLSEYAVRSSNDCLQLIRAGEENRAVRETQMNAASSRSHSIFTVLCEQRRISDQGGECTLRSKFNLVDLAGSEKWDIFQTMVDDRVAEMTNINRSLHILGKCIAALSKHSKQEHRSSQHVHVPYRESKLTRLLQDSLGGNSITRLIATISPASDCIEESISTLRFADRARSVVVSVRRNEQRPIDHALMKSLQSEVLRLRTILKNITRDSTTDSGLDVNKLLKEVEHLRIENEQLRRRCDGASKNRSANSRGTTSDEKTTLPPLVRNSNVCEREADVGQEKEETKSTRTEISTNSQFTPLTVTEQCNLVKRNQQLEAIITAVRTASSDFFSFKIEEDEMRNRLHAAFETNDRVLSSCVTSEPTTQHATAQMPQQSTPQSPNVCASSIKDQPVEQLSLSKKPPPTSTRDETSSDVPIKSNTPAPETRAAAALKYRVRQGKGHWRNADARWIDPEVELEEALKRQLRETKARMRKHIHLREWLLRKSEQENEILMQEEEDRRVLRAQELQKENNHRRRAEKQKRKLQRYYERLCADAVGDICEPSSPQTDQSTRNYEAHDMRWRVLENPDLEGPCSFLDDSRRFEVEGKSGLQNNTDCRKRNEVFLKSPSRFEEDPGAVKSQNIPESQFAASPLQLNPSTQTDTDSMEQMERPESATHCSEYNCVVPAKTRDPEDTITSTVGTTGHNSHASITMPLHPQVATCENRDIRFF